MRLPTAVQGPQAGVAALLQQLILTPLLQQPAAAPAGLTLPRFSALYIVLRASPSTLMRTIFAQALGFFEPAGPVCTKKAAVQALERGPPPPLHDQTFPSLPQGLAGGQNRAALLDRNRVRWSV